jgi:hypothetical protein
MRMETVSKFRRLDGLARLAFRPWEKVFSGEFDGRRPYRVLVKVIGQSSSASPRCSIAGGMMGSIAEQRLCRSLQAILADLPDGATIPDSEQFREVLACLQYFIPVILAEVYREWRFQGSSRPESFWILNLDDRMRRETASRIDSHDFLRR